MTWQLCSYSITCLYVCTHTYIRIRLHVCTYAYIHTYVNTHIHEHQNDVVWGLILFSLFFFYPSSVACGGVMVVLSHVCVYLCGWMCLCIHAYTCTRKQIAATQYPCDSLRCNTLQHSTAHCNTLHPMSFTPLCPTNSLRNIPDFRVCTRTDTRIYMDISSHTYTRTHHTYIRTHTHEIILYIYIHTYIYMYVYVYIHIIRICIYIALLRTVSSHYMNMHIYKYIYVYICVYTYNIYVYVYIIAPDCLGSARQLKCKHSAY